jgi:hypothetical protein
MESSFCPLFVLVFVTTPTTSKVCQGVGGFENQKLNISIKVCEKRSSPFFKPDEAVYCGTLLHFHLHWQLHPKNTFG